MDPGPKIELLTGWLQPQWAFQAAQTPWMPGFLRHTWGPARATNPGPHSEALRGEGERQPSNPIITEAPKEAGGAQGGVLHKRMGTAPP